MLENFKIYNKELENFILYFNENWLNYFKDGTLNLKYIDIKFRTNNCHENFNRILKSLFNIKKYTVSNIYRHFEKFGIISN